MNRPHYGKGLKFPIAGQFETSEGVDKILEDIQGLLLTDFGERVRRPQYGCGLLSRLWENLDTVANDGINDITVALRTFEPRVSLIEVAPIINRSEGIVIFKIRMLILETNTEANLIFPFKPASNISEK